MDERISLFSQPPLFCFAFSVSFLCIDLFYLIVFFFYEIVRETRKTSIDGGKLEQDTEEALCSRLVEKLCPCTE